MLDPPIPSEPATLEPQHFTPPLVVKAQLWYPPAATVTRPLVKPLTSTGTQLSTVELFPSWPAKFEPQHLAPPLLVSAQVCAGLPAEIATTPLIRPVAAAGTGLPVVVPLPNCPKSFAPQHRTPDVVDKAQVWLKPADILTTPLVSPFTSTGVELSLIKPLPS